MLNQIGNAVLTFDPREALCWKDYYIKAVLEEARRIIESNQLDQKSSDHKEEKIEE